MNVTHIHDCSFRVYCLRSVACNNTFHDSTFATHDSFLYLGFRIARYRKNGIKMDEEVEESSSFGELIEKEINELTGLASCAFFGDIV